MPIDFLPPGAEFTIVNFGLSGVHVSGFGSVTRILYRNSSVAEVKLSKYELVWVAFRFVITGGCKTKHIMLTYL